MSKVNCAACGVPICLDDGHERKLRDTHGNFWCPSGHSNYFPQKTDNERRIEDLKREVERLERRVAHRDGKIEQMRVEAGRCPWTGCDFATDHVTISDYAGFDLRALRTHLRAAHGMPTLAAVVDVEAEAS